MNDIKERINRVGLQILAASRNEIYMSMRYFDMALSALDYELNLTTKTIGTDGFKILFNRPGSLRLIKNGLRISTGFTSTC